MNRRTFVKTLPALTVLAGAASTFAEGSSETAAGLQAIDLPKPEKEGGKSVLASLWERKTIRNLSARSCRHKRCRICFGRRSE